jgi:archaellum component FlaC
MKVNFKTPKGIKKLLKQILERLEGIERKEDKLMVNVAKDFEALRVALDTATNSVAAKIDELRAGITNSMTDQQVADLKAGFGAISERLTELASDPADPVPNV